MKWYIISYDLQSPGQGYAKLENKIQSIANGYCKILASVWIIGHNGSAKTIHDHLWSVMDSNDRIFVSEITSDNWWTIQKGSADWFKKNVTF